MPAPTTPRSRSTRRPRLAAALTGATLLLLAADVGAQPGMGMGGMGMPGGAGPGGPGGPGNRDKKEGPAEAAPKDKQALRPVDPVPAQPKGLRRLQLFELHGHMRMRGDYFHRLDLGLGQPPAASGVDLGNKYFPPPSTQPETIEGAVVRASDANCFAYLSDQGVNPNKALKRCNRRNGVASANMRLRLDPTLHITDSVKVHATIDALDNMVLGSTPDSYLGENPYAPIDLYTRTQVPPSDGRNAWGDSITVKRAWGHIRFGWGLDLKFGRMPHHWGMGIVANDGNGYYRGDAADIVRMLDMDYGDSIDSLRLGYDFGKDRRRTHTLEASWDWAASGPTTAQLFGPQWASGNLVGQDFSAEKFDNVMQWRISLLRRDDPSMLRRKLSLGEPVVNYGAIVWLRRQALDRVTGAPGLGDGLGTNPTWGDDNSDDGLGRRGDALGNGDRDGVGDSGGQNYTNLLIQRRALVVTPDLWLRVNWRTLRVELEAAGVIGRYNERDLSEGPASGVVLTDIGSADLSRQWMLQLGYALEFKYGLFKDRFHIGLDQGFATGDDSEGVYGNPQSPLRTSGNQVRSAFRFNPAYHQDLLLFREVMGTASNAAYFRPWAAFYFLNNNMSGRLDVQYALAHQKAATYGGKTSWGLELNTALRYHDVREPIFVQLQYGVLFPFGGFDRPPAVYATDTYAPPNNGDAKAVQTLQAQVGIRF